MRTLRTARRRDVERGSGTTRVATLVVAYDSMNFGEAKGIVPVVGIVREERLQESQTGSQRTIGINLDVPLGVTGASSISIRLI